MPVASALNASDLLIPTEFDWAIEIEEVRGGAGVYSHVSRRSI